MSRKGKPNICQTFEVGPRQGPWFANGYVMGVESLFYFLTKSHFKESFKMELECKNTCELV